METAWNKLDKQQEPTIDIIHKYVNSPLWDKLCNYLETTYKSKPSISYSGCGAAPGWNVKYRKSGRGLCTLYPYEGSFTALVVIGEKEKEATEITLPMLSSYIQDLYKNTKYGMGQRWLMIQITSEEILKDVETLIAIRQAK